MKYNVSLSGQQLDAYLDFLRANRDVKAAELQEMDNQIASLQATRVTTPGTYVVNGMVNLKNVASYEEAVTWLERIAFVITHLGGRATTAQIVDYIVGLPGNDIERDKAINRVSSILSTNSKEDGKILREKLDGADPVYSIR